MAVTLRLMVVRRVAAACAVLSGLISPLAAQAQDAKLGNTSDVARDAFPEAHHTPAAAFEPVSDFTTTASPAAPAAATTEGAVSFYGREFAVRKTANGERFDPGAFTMAHKTLPFGTLVRITNLFNNKSVVVRVNDRGPFTSARIADLSTAAANVIGMMHAGVVRVRLEVLNAISAK